MARETDRLNAALAAHVKRTGMPWYWYEELDLHMPRSFCTDLNAAVTALNALGLAWTKVQIHHAQGMCATVAVFPDVSHTDRYETCEVHDATPSALATALVQAALALLGEEDASCPD